MPDEEPISLEVRALSGGYGRVPILHGIDLEVGEGEVVGILGPNGMGKSTLLKTLMGFLPAHAGSVRHYGDDITRLPPNRRARLGIGYVPQGRGIFPRLSVRENLDFARPNHGDGEEGARLDALLVDFPRLEPLLERSGETLSGGEQQVLALARSLMAAPELLLLDEPTEGIQPSIIDDLAQTLGRLRGSRGLSILLVEQNLDFITELSDRVLVLERGRIAGELAHGELSDRTKLDDYLGFGATRSRRVVLGSEREAPASVASLPRPPRAARPDPGPPASPSSRSPAGSPGRPLLPPSRRPDGSPARPLPSDPAQSPSRPMPAVATPPPPLQVSAMTIKRPVLSQMRAMAERFGMHLSDAELDEYREIMEPYIQAYDRIDAAPDHLPEVRYPRAPGYRPSPAENPLNAWYYRTEVRGAPDGPLRGKRIALKDTVCLAGVPMMNGSSIMEGYTPEIDATIVTRILEAGGSHRRQGALRELLPVRGVAHQRGRAGAQPLEAGLHGGRLVQRLGRPGGGGRGGHGDRGRSGRLHPDPLVELRSLRDEADPRPRALHRRHANRADHRSRWPDH